MTLFANRSNLPPHITVAVVNSVPNPKATCREILFGSISQHTSSCPATPTHFTSTPDTPRLKKEKKTPKLCAAKDIAAKDTVEQLEKKRRRSIHLLDETCNYDRLNEDDWNAFFELLEKETKNK